MIQATEEHPFYVEGKGWMEAAALGIGTSIVTRAGPSAKITKVERKAGEVTVYNFSVADFESFFVGSTGSGLWVHNACSGGKPALKLDDFHPDEVAKRTGRAERSAEHFQNELLRKADRLAGRHGIDRVDRVEQGDIGKRGHVEGDDDAWALNIDGTRHDAGSKPGRIPSKACKALRGIDWPLEPWD